LQPLLHECMSRRKGTKSFWLLVTDSVQVAISLFPLVVEMVLPINDMLPASIAFQISGVFSRTLADLMGAS
ncbi:MAG: hypothetical protein AAF399_26705, partial [Bacteroidota bacterium]